jgi:hypothetical protein
MERTLTIVTAGAALFLSLGLATLVEKLFLGGLFWCFFAARPLGSDKRGRGGL